MKKLFSKTGQWIKTHRRLSLCIAGGLVIAIAAGIAVYASTRPTPEIKDRPAAVTPTPEPVKYYSPLTGEEVVDEAATTTAVTAIMLENSPDARPQSGLRQAGVVYEAVAEGGITRFLAFYQHQKPQLIGPVRSLRMYYVDWLAPYQASAAHIGGSKFALDEIRNGNYRDIDQFFNASAYWRASDRYAPHNVYTSFERLDALNQSKGYTTSTFNSFPRANEAPAGGQIASQVSINFSSPTYGTTYTYNATTGHYARSLGGQPHIDREEGQITPRVVVAMYVDMNRVFEDGYRENITTTGTGRAVVFQGGTATEATWRKNSRSEPLELLDGNGQPLTLLRGQTWIAAVPNGPGSVSWQ